MTPQTLRVLRTIAGEQDEPEQWRAFRLDVIRQTPMPDIGHYGEPYPAVNGIVLTREQHNTLSAITTTFAGIFEKAVDALCRDAAQLERFGFPWVASELLALEAPGPLALGRFDLMLDAERGWQLLEYNADTPSGPRETVVVEALIARYLGWCGAGLGRSGPLLSSAVARIFGEAVAPGGTLGVMTDAGYSEDLAQTYFLARLLEGPLSKGGVHVVYGDVDNLSVRRGKLFLCDKPLDALYRYYPFEWLLGQQAFVDLFESIAEGKLRLLNGLRGLLAQNKGVLAWIWERRDDSSVFNAEERRVIEAHLPATHWIGDVPANREELVLKQVFGREGEEVYFGDAISPEDWEKCRTWGSYVVQRRVRALPVNAVIMTSTGPEVRDLWPVVGSYTAGGKWAGYYTRAGEPITTGHAKFIGTFWEREVGYHAGPERTINIMKLPWDRENRNGHKPAEPPDPMKGTSEDRNLGDLEPGDAIELWGEGNRVVTTIYECSEKIGVRDYVWRWSFLDDGSIVESSMDGQWRYPEHEIVPQGSALFSDLVGPGGLLEVFEARVRDDSVGDNPLYVELRGKRYRITSTGTVAPKRRGSAPKLAPWAQFVNDRDENVYFSFVAEDDEEDGVLGVWTTHVCLSFGRPLGETDVEAVYRKKR